MRFRLTREVMPEQELHEATARLLTTLVLKPAVWTAISTGYTELSAQQAAKMARMGVQAGWPDFLLVHDRMPFGLELKRPGGKLSATKTYRTKSGHFRERMGQSERFIQLVEAGMLIGVAHNLDEVVGLLREWRIPMRAGVRMKDGAAHLSARLG